MPKRLPRSHNAGMKHDASSKPVAATEGASNRSRRLVLGLAAALVVTVVAIAGLLRSEPVFYRSVTVASDPARAESLARRMLSKGSAVHAATRRSGAWDAAITADEVNAWLAVDLPRNHERLLPAGMAEPRVAFSPHHVHLGARLGSGWLSAVAWVDVEVRLRGVNQIGLALVDARLGALPLPRAAILRDMGRRLAALGLVTDLRRLDERPLLVVSVPSTYDAAGGRLESLAITDGELLLAGGASMDRSGVEAK